MPSAASTSVPPAVVAKVPAMTDNAGPSTSVSFASSCPNEVNGVSSATVRTSSTATGASLTGVTVSENACATGVETSSLPSSTRTWNDAEVVSPPSCRNDTAPAASCVPVNEVTARPPMRTVPLLRLDTVNVTPESISSGSV